ncbi:MAG: hypothetical protein M1825_003105 [Sarcosagium campestre]|nr:MAG: hypothetical protein M1825_003105 [Sarcosagium campestre]
MPAQATKIADTIAGLKKAISRGAKATPVERIRGTKRKAREYEHEGELGGSPRAYKRQIRHAGYDRAIIGRNPPRIDLHGEEVDDGEDCADADAAEGRNNLYGDVRLEYLLAPLSAAADLPSHPTFSAPYRAQSLTHLADAARHMVQKERRSLTNPKHLLTQFRGDHAWAPCGLMESPDDIDLFGSMSSEDSIMMQVETESAGGRREGPSSAGSPVGDAENGVANGAEEGPLLAPRRMRTRAQAHAEPEEGAVPRLRSDSDGSLAAMIHPIFTVPLAALPDRDYGLPPAEAEETRRLLLQYVQKQEEVCRGSERLYNGLLRADRWRGTVWKWTRAEGHLGEMSDGEDWYDKEEWGLEEDLKKGYHEDEEEVAAQAKKTRRGRA